MTNREQELEFVVQEFLAAIESQDIAENSYEGKHLRRLKSMAEDALAFGQDENEEQE